MDVEIPARPRATRRTTSGRPRPALPLVGDCNGSNEVTIEEIITMVNIALGRSAVASCAGGDANGDGEVAVDEIIRAVNDALIGCE